MSYYIGDRNDRTVKGIKTAIVAEKRAMVQPIADLAAAIRENTKEVAATGTAANTTMEAALAAISECKDQGAELAVAAAAARAAAEEAGRAMADVRAEAQELREGAQRAAVQEAARTADLQAEVKRLKDELEAAKLKLVQGRMDGFVRRDSTS